MPLKPRFIVRSCVFDDLAKPMNSLTSALIAVNTLGLAILIHDWLSPNSPFAAAAFDLAFR